ncbi:MAG: hypothetical protein ACXW15_00105, partial [Acidimicrobiia bacterium]
MPDIPEHLLRRSAAARAEALGVPLEQVLAEMGLTGVGETPQATIEEVTSPVQPASPDTTIPEDLRAREEAARRAAIGEFEAKAPPTPVAPPAVTRAPEEPAVVVEEPVPVVEEPAAAAAAVAAPASAAAGSKIPEALVGRSAEAKAKATGRPVEEILAELSGGAPEEPAVVVEEPVPVVEEVARAPEEPVVAEP